MSCFAGKDCCCWEPAVHQQLQVGDYVQLPVSCVTCRLQSAGVYAVMHVYLSSSSVALCALLMAVEMRFQDG